MDVYKKSGRLLVTMLTLVLSMGTIWAQNLNVTGKVTDLNSDPIIWAMSLYRVQIQVHLPTLTGRTAYHQLLQMVRWYSLPSVTKKHLLS